MIRQWTGPVSAGPSPDGEEIQLTPETPSSAAKSTTGRPRGRPHKSDPPKSAGAKGKSLERVLTSVKTEASVCLRSPKRPHDSSREERDDNPVELQQLKERPGGKRMRRDPDRYQAGQKDAPPKQRKGVQTPDKPLSLRERSIKLKKPKRGLLRKELDPFIRLKAIQPEVLLGKLSKQLTKVGVERQRHCTRSVKVSTLSNVSPGSKVDVRQTAMGVQQRPSKKDTECDKKVARLQDSIPKPWKPQNATPPAKTMEVCVIFISQNTPIINLCAVFIFCIFIIM